MGNTAVKDDTLLFALQQLTLSYSKSYSSADCVPFVFRLCFIRLPNERRIKHRRKTNELFKGTS